MIRQVIAVLKKHLDEAYRDELDQWEALETTPYDVLMEHPSQHELRYLAYELIGVIKGTDVSRLIQLPKHAELFDFIKKNSPDGTDEEFLHYQTRELRVWLAGFRRWRGEGLIVRT